MPCPMTAFGPVADIEGNAYADPQSHQKRSYQGRITGECKLGDRRRRLCNKIGWESPKQGSDTIYRFQIAHQEVTDSCLILGTIREV